MKVVNLCNEYCIGCGLCESELKAIMKQDEKGFLRPQLVDNADTIDFLNKVCPVVNNYSDNDGSPWGTSIKMLAGYSNDIKIRKMASSGGVLTSLAIFLLESGKVDGVIQVETSAEEPTKTVCRVSVCREDVIACCGSRYAISSPWIRLNEMVEEGKTYAAIGKPCDIVALKKLINENSKYRNIKYLLSFFCAGLPSDKANDELLSQLGCKKEECVALTYRGNGWPGEATAVTADGSEYKMEYSKAWGGILGRDVNPFCRLCMDGIGEAADIACGDGWYIKNNQPDFSEGDGRNVIIVRSQNGLDLMNAAVEAGMLTIEEWSKPEELEIIQKYQYVRRTTMRAKLWGYKICGRPTPHYDKKVLKMYSDKAFFSHKMKIVLGTIKRIVTKKI